MRIGLYRGATEGARRRTLRPTHDKLSTNLDYAPPAWRQRSHRKQLPRKGMAKHTAVECRTRLRIRRWCTVFTFLGADGERSRQRRRSATDAAYPLRVHIGPFFRYSPEVPLMLQRRNCPSGGLLFLSCQKK